MIGSFQNEISFRPIGIIHSPFKKPAGMPIQPASDDGTDGWIELLPELEEGLVDLDGFSHIILLYHLHLTRGFRLKVKPFLDDRQRGLFSTRAPSHPNPVGLSVVRLLAVEGAVLRVRNIDIVDETPLLDIKPYVPDFNPNESVRIGWLALHREQIGKGRSDDRFRV